MNWLILTAWPKCLLKPSEIVLFRYCIRGLVELEVLLKFEYSMLTNIDPRPYLFDVFCIWQDIDLGEYVGVNDDWMDVISSQGLSLLSVDVAGSQVTDDGLRLLKDCSSLQALTLSYCDQFSEYGLKHISGTVTILMVNFFSPECVYYFTNIGRSYKWFKLDWWGFVLRLMYKNYESCIAVFIFLFFLNNYSIVLSERFWCFLHKKNGEIHSCLNRIHLNYQMILIDFFMIYSKVIETYTCYTFQPHLNCYLVLAYKSISDCIAEY